MKGAFAEALCDREFNAFLIKRFIEDCAGVLRKRGDAKAAERFTKAITHLRGIHARVTRFPLAFGSKMCSRALAMPRSQPPWTSHGREASTGKDGRGLLESVAQVSQLSAVLRNRAHSAVRTRLRFSGSSLLASAM